MSQAVEQGTLYVISAPSGAGKTSLVAEMLRNDEVKEVRAAVVRALGMINSDVLAPLAQSDITGF